MDEGVSQRIEVVEPPVPPKEPVNGWAIVAALIVGILFDVLVTRGSGGTGVAVFFLSITFLYLAVTWGEHSHPARWVVAGMLAMLSARLVWLAVPVQFFVGVLLLPALAMSCWGVVPFITDWWFFVIQSVGVGGRAIFKWLAGPPRKHGGIKFGPLLAVAMPVIVVSIFAVVFVQANPDLAKQVSAWVTSLGNWLQTWDVEFVDFLIIAFIAWLALGQLVPMMRESLTLNDNIADPIKIPKEKASEWYAPLRNTLIAVNLLFVVYLAFEFRTLWFREFPQGFYYAGYAHQGAAWLTLALALATLLLSAFFQSAVLADPRISSLKRWAWGWSLANLLLAISVYNRLFIYINFNGMTRMRMVGLFGITTVVVGFLLVVWKIHRNRRFLWLIQRHLWTLTLAVYLLVITPVDYIVHQWNVRQILSGHLAPAVQITEHDVDPSGWLALVPLLKCDDKLIREGIRAKLSEFAATGIPVEGSMQTKASTDWTAYQIVREQLQAELNRDPERWQKFETRADRKRAWQRFKEYAYQWY